MVHSGQPIMIVEDSPEDFEATIRAFQKSGLNNPIIHCTDGDEALDYLHRLASERGRGTNITPGLILLDLNLPGTDGRQVLAEIKSDYDLKIIPVIVLTTSTDERDIEECYRAGANTYIQKPIDMAKFVESIQRLKEFWFEVAVYPKTEGQ